MPLMNPFAILSPPMPPIKEGWPSFSFIYYEQTTVWLHEILLNYADFKKAVVKYRELSYNY
jgi:hypothetical protein